MDSSDHCASETVAKWEWEVPICPWLSKVVMGISESAKL